MLINLGLQKKDRVHFLSKKKRVDLENETQSCSVVNMYLCSTFFLKEKMIIFLFFFHSLLYANEIRMSVT